VTYGDDSIDCMKCHVGMLRTMDNEEVDRSGVMVDTL